MDAELADVLDTCWRLLGRGAADRRSPMHTPVVASVDADGRPQARVMVLRAADRATARLRFHTDARSPKCAELDGAAVAVTLYHPGEAIQLRLAGAARVVTDGAEVDRIWAAATDFARRAYLVEAAPGTPLPGPGSGLPAGVDGRKPEAPELVPARANFALVMLDIGEIDWLHLAQDGHRRALFTLGDGGWAAGWCVP
ncbi:pyridoxamine 5'-phosphate oxidase family protein [Sandarakinorhabdus sp. DWP1-3-1]|uniref:pyridoxamine 5'-phosphate oxidase family protein n=1 Tax=Sandarakinorhabdus sp. DWP1-3-1 TaxID=2804627 RepID=UPI003CF8F8C2